MSNKESIVKSNSFIEVIVVKNDNEQSDREAIQKAIDLLQEEL